MTGSKLPFCSELQYGNYCYIANNSKNFKENVSIRPGVGLTVRNRRVSWKIWRTKILQCRPVTKQTCVNELYILPSWTVYVLVKQKPGYLVCYPKPANNLIKWLHGVSIFHSYYYDHMTRQEEHEKGFTAGWNTKQAQRPSQRVKFQFQTMPGQGECRQTADSAVSECSLPHHPLMLLDTRSSIPGQNHQAQCPWHEL